MKQQHLGFRLIGLLFILSLQLYADDSVFWAAKIGDTAHIATALGNGLNIDQVDEWGNNLLIYAASYNQTAVVEQLIAHGANLGQADRRGHTPLLLAIRHYHVHIAHVLMVAGAQPHHANAAGLTPWILTCRRKIQELSVLYEADMCEHQLSPLMHMPDVFLNAWQRYQPGLVLIGIVTDQPLEQKRLLKVLSAIEQQDPLYLFAYVDLATIQSVGLQNFSGFILPGGGCHYPSRHLPFGLKELEAKDMTPRAQLYQQVLNWLIDQPIPVLAICAGAQQLALHQGARLKIVNTHHSQIVIQPLTRIHELMVGTHAADAPIELEVYRSHLFGIDKASLTGTTLEAAAYDGDIVMAFTQGEYRIGIQPHFEFYYTHAPDATPNQKAQSRLLDAFFHQAKKRFLSQG